MYRFIDECRHLDEAGFKRQEAATGTAQVAVSMLGGPEVHGTQSVSGPDERMQLQSLLSFA